MLKIYAMTLGILFSLFSYAQNSESGNTATLLKYFNGQVTASLEWGKQPSTAQKNQLKIDLKSSNGQAYELDASDVSANLFMTEMPDMGSETQTVVAIADGSGNPVAGRFIINAMQLSMSGNWTLQLTLPNPDGSGKTEMQQYQFSVR